VKLWEKPELNDAFFKIVVKRRLPPDSLPVALHGKWSRSACGRPLMQSYITP